MQEKLVEFANLRRENGVRVSLAETLDAFGAADVTGLGEKDSFRSALRATMIKRKTELPVFEELFDLYFSGLGEIIKQASQAVQQALSMSDQEFQKFLEEVEEMLKQEGKKLSELAKQLLQNNSGQMERKIREAARAIKLNNIERTIEENYFARALARELGLDKIEQEIRQLRDQLEKVDISAKMRRRWRSISIAGSSSSTISSAVSSGWSVRSATSRRARSSISTSSARRAFTISPRKS